MENSTTTPRGITITRRQRIVAGLTIVGLVLAVVLTWNMLLVHTQHTASSQPASAAMFILGDSDGVYNQQHLSTGFSGWCAPVGPLFISGDIVRCTGSNH
jgi:hypothetical protein